MVNSTSTHSINRDAKDSLGVYILQIVFVLIGLALVILSVLLPVSMGATTEYDVGAAFRSGYVRVLTLFITNVSMVSSFVVAAVILTFEKSKANTVSVLFGVLTLSVFSAEISLSLYLSLVRPLTARAPPLLAIYLTHFHSIFVLKVLSVSWFAMLCHTRIEAPVQSVSTYRTS